MNYCSYYEEKNIINCEEYREIRGKLLKKYGEQHTKKSVLRKLRFVYQGHTFVDSLENKQAQFSICLSNEEDRPLVLEKKSCNDQVTTKATVKITKEEYDRIMSGDIEWIQKKKNGILQDFYIQYKINTLVPDNITEYHSEMITYGSREEVIFNTSIRRIIGTKDLFSQEGMVIECLPEDKAAVTYRRKQTVPDRIISMLQTREEAMSKLAYN